MKFSEIIEQASELLQRKRRITYRSLKLEFDLDDEQLDTLKEELLFSYPELAHHYSRSGNTEKAVKYLQLAGQQAVQRSANVEAISQFTTALKLLQALPDTPERSQQELVLQVALGVPLTATKGYAAPEAQ